MKKTIAAFDFDGTLISIESMSHVIKSVLGEEGFKHFTSKNKLYIWGATYNILNEFCVKKIIYKVLKDRELEEIKQKAEELYYNIYATLNQAVMEKLDWHLSQGHHCIFVSQALDVFLEPWAKKLNFHSVLATDLEVKDDRLTGKVIGKTCYGLEKSRRLLQLVAPDNREDYIIYAYGNSRGDKAMLAEADFPYWVKDGVLSLAK